MGVVRRTRSESPDVVDSDERLLERCREGSEDAFATLVSRYEAQLTRHCARLIGGAAAQDAVQDAFLSAWMALQAGADVRAARPWLFTIAHRKALAALRDQRRAGVELSETSATSRSPEDVAAESANVRSALAALAALPGAQRNALIGSAVQGRSGTQIARSLGISESAVRQLVFKARASVRTAAAACLAPPLVVLAALRRALSGLGRRASALHGAASGQLASATVAAKLGALAVVGAVVAGAGAGAFHEISSRGHPGPPRPTVASAAPRTEGAGIPDGARGAAHMIRRSPRPSRSTGAAVTRHGRARPPVNAAATRSRAPVLSASAEVRNPANRGAGSSAATDQGAGSAGPATTDTGQTAVTGVSTTVTTTRTSTGNVAGQVAQTVQHVVPKTLGTVTQAVQDTVAPTVGAVGQTVQDTVTSAAGTVGSATNAVTQTVQGVVSTVTGATGPTGPTGGTGATGATGVTGLLGGLGTLIGGH